MIQRVWVYGLLGWVMGVLAVPSAEAHLKDYLVTQSSATAERGEWELEFWNDMNFAEADNSGSYSSEHKLELEYGLTDHLQLAYYEVYSWDRAEDWERKEFKVEAKYRVLDDGPWPVALALYTEYKNPDGRRQGHSDEVENKVILSKDIGRWNATGNFIFEKKINTGSHWEYEYTAAVSYGLTPRTRLALEVKQGLGDSRDVDFSERQPLYLVPEISVSPAPHVTLLVGPAFGLTRASDDLQLHSIVEVEF